MVNVRNHTAVQPSAAWPPLLPGEELCWEGRPAPRCYVFRLWRHALFGLVLTIICAIWSWLGVQQAAEQGWPWLALVPLPFLGYALWLACGQLLAARMEWERVAYAITSNRLILRRGVLRSREIALPLERVSWFRLEPHGEELATFRIRGDECDPLLVMHCIEYPGSPAALLEAAIRARSDSDD